MNPRRDKWARRASVAASCALMIGAVVSAPASAQTAPAACPDVIPVSEVQEGMEATGYTVVKGEQPTPFTATVAGVITNGLGPGKDMIVVEVASPATVAAGGIWHGMSGSPLYVDGRLLGALAYSLSSGDGDGTSSVGGVTPAEYMMRLLDYSTEGGTESGSAQDAPRKVALSKGIHAKLVESGAAGEGDTSLEQLMLPLSVSGLSGRGLAQMRAAIAREDLPLIPYVGSSANATQPGATGSLAPGDNFASAFSYGDITTAQVATATFVCDGMAVALGHPIDWEGRVAIGANEADSLTIVNDDDNPYKLANVGAGVGTIDQDRLAGVRAVLGQMQDLITISSTVTAEATGQTRDGETSVVNADSVPGIAFLHMFSNVDVTHDEIGEGSSDVTWTASGTRADGTPWELTRTDMFATSEYGPADIAQQSFVELQRYLAVLVEQELEYVHLEDVEVNATVQEEVERYEIENLLLSTDGLTYEDTNRVKVAPGQIIYMRVVLSPYENAGEERTVDLELTVPKKASRSGYIQVQGFGEDDYYYGYYGDSDVAYGYEWCYYDYYECGVRVPNKVESFDELIDYIEGRRTNNEIKARLSIYERRQQFNRRDIAALDSVVAGYDYARVRVIDDGEREARD